VLKVLKTGKCPMSTESLYQWVWQSKYGNKAADNPFKKIHNLLRQGKRRWKRGSRKDSRGIIHDRVPIEKRPKVVKQRKRPGDIEVDFMMGKNHKGAILVILIEQPCTLNCISLKTEIAILLVKH
jgi:IS30 family transposase